MNSFDVPKRRAIADRHISAAADSLQHPEVRKSLNGYPERLLEILNWLYVPNLRDGVYEAPRRYRDSEHIPLVVVAPGESVRYRTDNMATMHPEQRSNLQSALEYMYLYDDSMATDDMVRQVNQSALERAGEVKALGDDYLDTAVARVHPEWGKLELVNNAYEYCWVATRPMIVMDALARIDEGITLAHEITHVDQFLEDTLVHDDRNYEKTRVELVPNHVEYEIVKAKYGGHIPSRYWYVERKEKVRILANGTGEDAFQANRKLLQVMKRFSYDETFGHSPYSPEQRDVAKSSKKRNKHGRVGVKKR